MECYRNNKLEGLLIITYRVFNDKMTIDWQHLSPGEHDLSLKGAAGFIEAKLHLPQKDSNGSSPKAVVICCHPHPQFGGTMTNKVVHTLTKTFSKMGIPALRYNFRGIGKSEGTYDNGQGESEDLLILSDLIQKSWPEQQLWLAGFSFGSWISAGCAMEAGAKQLLSIAPPVQYFDVADFQMPECPWLVLMGEQDEVVDPEQVFDWINSKSSAPQQIKFPETGHFFHGQLVNMTKLLQQHYLPVLSTITSHDD